MPIGGALLGVGVRRVNFRFGDNTRQRQLAIYADLLGLLA
jgi:hypothetical protein